MAPKAPKSKLTTPSRNPNVHAAMSVRRPVAAFARSDAAGHVINEHFHVKAQLIYAIKGVMTVHAEHGVWTLPPSHALWVPAGVKHAIRMETPVEMRTLYFAKEAPMAMPGACQILAVTPLLRELVIRAMDVSPEYPHGSYADHLMSLIMAETQALKTITLEIKLPHDRRLLKLARWVIDHPGDSLSLAQLGTIAGLSARSVIRLYPQETGLTFNRWRQQVRLARALVLAEQGRSYTEIAFELGYSSGSAFTRMFRKQLGELPSSLLRPS